jgi:hypothetical protein
VKLEDEKALIDYNIIPNSTMELLPKIQILIEKEGFFFFVGDGVIGCVFFFLLGVPVDQQGLAFKGKRLENDKIVCESNLIRNYIIDLLQTIQIFVKTPRNKKLPFDVDLGNNFLSIKEKVEEKEGLIYVWIIHVFYIHTYMYVCFICVLFIFV